MQKKLVVIWLGLVLTGLIAAGCAGSQRLLSEPSDVGWVTREIFRQPLYEAFQAGYDTARIVPEVPEMMGGVREGVDVIVFFGGWCSDSKREVPRFLKLMDQAGMPEERIRLFALDRTKKSDDGLTRTYGIEKVPTFIFLKQGEEVGRITESPRTSLEADVLTIFVEASRR